MLFLEVQLLCVGDLPWVRSGLVRPLSPSAALRRNTQVPAWRIGACSVPAWQPVEACGFVRSLPCACCHV